MLLLNLFEFIPAYIVLKFYATDFYISKLIKKLYALSKNERDYLIAKKLADEENTPPKKNRSCLYSFIKALFIILVLLGIGYWALSGESEAVYQ